MLQTRTWPTELLLDSETCNEMYLDINALYLLKTSKMPLEERPAFMYGHYFFTMGRQIYCFISF
jgi:hypothetical protein